MILIISFSTIRFCLHVQNNKTYFQIYIVLDKSPFNQTK